jgi:uncharacterized protein (DUF433 family)
MAASEIMRDPMVMSGMYCVRGTRIPVCVIKARHRSGESVMTISKDYDLAPRTVKAALRWRNALAEGHQSGKLCEKKKEKL